VDVASSGSILGSAQLVTGLWTGGEGLLGVIFIGSYHRRDCAVYIITI